MHQFGCISEPEVKEFALSEHDVAIVLASDGLWDAEGVVVGDVLKAATLSNRKEPRNLCEALLKKARSGGGPSDDCTIACMTFV